MAVKISPNRHTYLECSPRRDVSSDAHLNESDLQSNGLLALVVDIGLHFDALPTDIGGALQLCPQRDGASLTAETAAGALVLAHHRLLSESQTRTQTHTINTHTNPTHTTRATAINQIQRILHYLILIRGAVQFRLQLIGFTWLH